MLSMKFARQTESVNPARGSLIAVQRWFGGGVVGLLPVEWLVGQVVRSEQIGRRLQDEGIPKG